MKIKATLDEYLVDVEFTRDAKGQWEITGHVGGEAVHLAATNYQAGTVLFWMASSNPENTELDSLLYNLLSDAQKNSGLVP